MDTIFKTGFIIDNDRIRRDVQNLRRQACCNGVCVFPPTQGQTFRPDGKTGCDPDNAKVRPFRTLPGKRVPRSVENDSAPLETDISRIHGNTIAQTMCLPVKQQSATTFVIAKFSLRSGKMMFPSGITRPGDDPLYEMAFRKQILGTLQQAVLADPGRANNGDHAARRRHHRQTD